MSDVAMMSFTATGMPESGRAARGQSRGKIFERLEAGLDDPGAVAQIIRKTIRGRIIMRERAQQIENAGAGSKRGSGTVIVHGGLLDRRSEPRDYPA